MSFPFEENHKKSTKQPGEDGNDSIIEMDNRKNNDLNFANDIRTPPSTQTTWNNDKAKSRKSQSKLSLSNRRQGNKKATKIRAGASLGVMNDEYLDRSSQHRNQRKNNHSRNNQGKRSHQRNNNHHHQQKDLLDEIATGNNSTSSTSRRSNFDPYPTNVRRYSSHMSSNMPSMSPLPTTSKYSEKRSTENHNQEYNTTSIFQANSNNNKNSSNMNNNNNNNNGSSNNNDHIPQASTISKRKRRRKSTPKSKNSDHFKNDGECAFKQSTSNTRNNTPPNPNINNNTSSTTTSVKKDYLSTMMKNMEDPTNVENYNNKHHPTTTSTSSSSAKKENNSPNNSKRRNDNPSKKPIAEVIDLQSSDDDDDDDDDEDHGSHKRSQGKEKQQKEHDQQPQDTNHDQNDINSGTRIATTVQSDLAISLESTMQKLDKVKNGHDRNDDPTLDRNEKKSNQKECKEGNGESLNMDALVDDNHCIEIDDDDGDDDKNNQGNVQQIQEEEEEEDEPHQSDSSSTSTSTKNSDETSKESLLATQEECIDTVDSVTEKCEELNVNDSTAPDPTTITVTTSNGGIGRSSSPKSNSQIDTSEPMEIDSDSEKDDGHIQDTSTSSTSIKPRENQQNDEIILSSSTSTSSPSTQQKSSLFTTTNESHGVSTRTTTYNKSNEIDLSNDADDADNDNDTTITEKKATNNAFSIKKVNNNSSPTFNGGSSNTSRKRPSASTASPCVSPKKSRINFNDEGGSLENLPNSITKGRNGEANDIPRHRSEIASSSSKKRKNPNKECIVYEESDDSDEDTCITALERKNDHSEDKYIETMNIFNTTQCDSSIYTPLGSPLPQNRKSSTPSTPSTFDRVKGAVGKMFKTPLNSFKRPIGRKKIRKDDVEDDIESVTSAEEVEKRNQNQKKKRRRKNDDEDIYVDESFSNNIGTTRRPQTRSVYKRRVLSSQYIEAVDEGESSQSGQSNGSVFEDVNKQKIINEEEQVQIAIAESKSLSERVDQKSLRIDVNCIAIGRKVQYENCSLRFQFGQRKPILQISYKARNQKKSMLHNINVDDDIKLIHYYLPAEATKIKKVKDEEMMNSSLLILSVDKNKDNSLSSLTNKYDPDDERKKYIVIDFNESEHLKKLLEAMKSGESTETVSVYIETGLIKFHELHKYTSAFKKKGKQCKRMTRSSSTFKSYLRNVTQEELVLNFPFEVSHSELNELSYDLVVANGTTSVVSENDNHTKSKEDTDDDKFVNVWKHSHIIRGEDYERLNPMEYLNDTLIDLWMTWILRKETASSNIHFFSTQFFQKIQDQGPESVQSWTRRRKINIFEKKIIFIPINDHLHWSLCVVVNPGNIHHGFFLDDESVKDIETRDDFPMLLFFDSLKAHEKSKVKKLIYEWLNLEAKRLNHFKSLSKKLLESNKKGHKKDNCIFSEFSMPLLTPTIPYQNNGWDCGVFVCRYAFAVLSLRHVNFQVKLKTNKLKDRNNLLKELLAKLVTQGERFIFNMDEIQQLRRDFATLIDRLSDLWKKKEKEKSEDESKEDCNQSKSSDDKDEQCGKETCNTGGCHV